jgi:hypothetical protein
VSLVHNERGWDGELENYGIFDAGCGPEIEFDEIEWEIKLQISPAGVSRFFRWRDMIFADKLVRMILGHQNIMS